MQNHDRLDHLGNLVTAAERKERRLDRETIAEYRRCLRSLITECRRHWRTAKRAKRPAIESLQELPDGVLRILREVKSETGVCAAVVVGYDRGPTACAARARAAWKLREAGYSLPEIGGYFGNRHHTTIMHSIRKEEARRSG